MTHQQNSGTFCNQFVDGQAISGWSTLIEKCQHLVRAVQIASQAEASDQQQTRSKWNRFLSGPNQLSGCLFSIHEVDSPFPRVCRHQFCSGLEGLCQRQPDMVERRTKYVSGRTLDVIFGFLFIRSEKITLHFAQQLNGQIRMLPGSICQSIVKGVQFALRA